MSDWVRIARYRNFGRLGLTESLLQSADIPYEVMGVAATYSYVVDPMTVWVPPDRADEARALLANESGGVLGVDGNAESDKSD